MKLRYSWALYRKTSLPFDPRLLRRRHRNSRGFRVDRSDPVAVHFIRVGQNEIQIRFVFEDDVVEKFQGEFREFDARILLFL